MSQTTIKKIPVHHGGRLHYLFDRALEQDFAYFSPAYRQNVRYTNSRLKMQIGTIHPKRLFLGLYNNGELNGYSISSVQPGMQAFLYWLYIAPDMRKQQLGNTLLHETEAHLKTRKVDTISLITHNQQRFYERNDYILNKILTEVDAGVDMYLMSKVMV